MKLSDEQREEIQKAMTYNGRANGKLTQCRYFVQLLLYSEKALIEENERIKNAYHDLSEDWARMSNERNVAQDSQQTWKSEAERLEKRMKEYESQSIKNINLAEDYQEQLKQATEALSDIKTMLDMDHSDYQKFVIWKKADDFLSSLSQGTKKLVKGETIIDWMGKQRKLIDIQYEHNRFQVSDISGWIYGIESIKSGTEESNG